MKIRSRITDYSLAHPKRVTSAIVVAVVIVLLASSLPSLRQIDAMPNWVRQVSGWLDFLPAVRVDTDPENMLAKNEPVRRFHDKMKKRLDIHDFVVVGVVNEENPDGVFNPSSLRKVYELTEFAKKLTGDSEEGQQAGLEPGQGVLAADIIAPSTVDNMIPAGKTIRFERLMSQPPKSLQAARKVLADARRIPFLRGTMVPPAHDDNKAVCIYLPITTKDISYQIYRAMSKKADELGGPEKFYVTGLPVAEDTFGVEMFSQMAISAPTAMLVIFLLLLVFFRKLVLIISPMIVALMSVILTMGVLIIAGFPIHIMSSMIPIFIMPIAVLNSVHIISEFFEKYQATRDRAATMRAVIDELFLPMLYTSLTTVAGFASLALTPIPPVQVFGIFVAAGVLVAWLLTMLFIPAYVMFISPKTLKNFGAEHTGADSKPASGSLMSRFLSDTGRMTYRRAKPIMVVTMIVLVVAGWGISLVNVNDNPIKWFAPSHPIREADRVLNKHFGGTYMAYLALEYKPQTFDAKQYAGDLAKRANKRSSDVSAMIAKLPPVATAAAVESDSFEKFFTKLKDRLRPNPDTATDEDMSVRIAMEGFLDRELDRLEFADPPVKFDKTKAPIGLEKMAKAFNETFNAVLGKVKARAESIARSGVTTRAGFLDKFGNLDELLNVSSLDATITREGKLTLEAAKAAARFFIGEERELDEVFKSPDVLRQIGKLSEALVKTGIVGKSNSLTDIVETVNRDLHGGQDRYYRIPNTKKAIGSCITQFQSSHRPQDLTHFVTTYDYQTAGMWVQLKSGDNKDMAAVVKATEQYLRNNPLPDSIRYKWFGLTYINVIWQNRMVKGMLGAFAGSFLVVFFLMIILFGSVLWGLLSMIPLTVTIAAIYGAIGIIGKDYDMPVAILSSMTLGLAVDFAIHFLARSRHMHARHHTWHATAPLVFGGPARAISRNIIVIAIGFLPLLLAPLTPYKTVGTFMATILLVSGIATFLILSAMVRLFEKRLFIAIKPVGTGCNCTVCIVSSVTLVAVVALSLYQFHVELSSVIWATIALTPILALLCHALSRREKCKTLREIEKTFEETDNE